MRLSHNIASLEIYKSQMKVSQKQSTALSRISSGYKVSCAKDDPNAIAQSERTRMQIRGFQMAAQNNQDGVSMLQTAEGGLDGMTQMLQRIRELTVQAGSSANSPEDRKNIQSEIDQMVKGIGDIVNNTEFNGKAVLNKTKLDPTDIGEAVNLDMQIGANSGDSVKIPIYDLSPGKLAIEGSGALAGKSINDINIEDGGTSIDDALTIVDNAIDKVVNVRSKYGSLENRFEGTLNDVNEISDTMENVDSSLRDADIAKEMMEYSKDNILIDAANAMMAQTNKFPQDVLQILQNVRSK
ncbi:flagellin [Clostridium thailandense]|uniref:flagellin N-terminal helical domain-containing protein n=1 Tax=Clostridium thailandense TaxID=2794346 RepID=UPI00398956BE